MLLGDDVEAEFAEEKKREVEKDQGPELEVNILPGWGTWNKYQTEPSWMREAREEDKRYCQELSISDVCLHGWIDSF